MSDCKNCYRWEILLKSSNSLRSIIENVKIEFPELLNTEVIKEIDEFLNCSWQDDSEFGAITEELVHSVKQELIEPTDIPPSEMPEHEEVNGNEDESQAIFIESKTQEVLKAHTKYKFEEKSVEKEIDDDQTITPKIAIKSAEALFEPEEYEEEIADEDPFPLGDSTSCAPSSSRSIASSRKLIMQQSISEAARNGNKWFNCTICEFCFTSKAKLMQHIESHEITHECSQCEIGFFSLEEALQHSCEEYAKKHNKEDENSNDFNSYSASLVDEEDDIGSPVIMPYETEEEEKMTIEDEEEDEEKVQVKNPEDSLMKCEHCDTYFLNEEELREHEEVTHALGAIKDKLTGLVYKIPTENSYCCGLCGKSCKNLVAFNTHLRSRHKANPMKPPDNTCDICGKAYDTLTRLRRHMSYQHGSRNPSNIDPGKPGHGCDVCGKSFPSSYRLKHHYRTHTGEKPCKCEFCGKCFRNTSHLNDHRRIHTGERPYKCMHCGNSYIQGSQLKAHLRTRHNLTI